MISKRFIKFFYKVTIFMIQSPFFHKNMRTFSTQICNSSWWKCLTNEFQVLEINFLILTCFHALQTFFNPVGRNYKKAQTNQLSLLMPKTNCTDEEVPRYPNQIKPSLKLDYSVEFHFQVLLKPIETLKSQQKTQNMTA